MEKHSEITSETRKSIFEILIETFDDIPEEELAKLPTDGAEEHDHYLYGSPKRNASVHQDRS
ncbi:MAG TPA: hypothetical protein VF627_15340 [Abditibacterium sp.]|jgi:hypothetical protein